PQANNPPSLAEQLYRKAVQLNKPRLIFLPAQDASWSPNRVAPPLADDHPKHSLHHELTREHTTYFFKSPEHLLSLLGPAILSWQEAQQGTRGSVQQRIEQLTYWWQYTLLRCSLTSQADRYPTEAFTLLLQQQREPEVLQLVDSLSDPVRKVSVLLQVAGDLADRVAPPLAGDPLNDDPQNRVAPSLAGDPSDPDEKRHQLLTKAHVIARSIKVGKPRSEALLAVCTEFARTQQWERAEAVLRILNDGKATVQAYGRLWIELMRAQQPEHARQIWARLEAASQGIELSETRAEALYELSGELVQAQQWQRATDTWDEAETFAQAIEDAETREQMLRKLDAAACSLVIELSRARQWTLASASVKKLRRSATRVRALCLLAIESATLGRRERAQSLLTRAVKVAHTIEPDT